MTRNRDRGAKNLDNNRAKWGARGGPEVLKCSGPPSAPLRANLYSGLAVGCPGFAGLDLEAYE